MIAYALSKFGMRFRSHCLAVHHVTGPGERSSFLVRTGASSEVPPPPPSPPIVLALASTMKHRDVTSVALPMLPYVCSQSQFFCCSCTHEGYSKSSYPNLCQGMGVGRVSWVSMVGLYDGSQ